MFYKKSKWRSLYVDENSTFLQQWDGPSQVEFECEQIPKGVAEREPVTRR